MISQEKILPEHFTEKDKIRFLSHLDVKGGNDCWNWKGSLIQTGYGNFSLYVEGTRRWICAHRASYLINKGNILDGLVVMHSCNNKLCSNPNHLSVGTYKENSQGALRDGRYRTGKDHWTQDLTKIRFRSRGEKSGLAKLTSKQVEEIKNLFKETEISAINLAKQFGISRTHVYQLLRGTRWKHLSGC